MWVNISPCVWMWKSPTGLQAGNLSGDFFLRFFLLTGGTFLDHHAVLIDTIVAILPVDQPSKIGVDFLGKTNTSGCGKSSSAPHMVEDESCIINIIHWWAV